VDTYTHGTVHIAYVNVFDVTRCFGGPEEGGWWYDAGECIESHRVAATTEEELDTMCRDLIDKLREDYPRTGKRYSVLGGIDYDVFRQDHEGRDFPECIPRYE
jgi:hypothetical protein